jgi:hypothetical protein
MIMYKYILAVAVVALTACGSAKTEESSTADSTAVVTPASLDTAVVTDSTVVTAPVDGPTQK